MKFYLNIIICISLILSCTTKLITQSHNWVRSNPGGGGSFSTIGAGPTGTIVACSDLSGAYVSYDNGSSWSPRGAAQGLTETHISGIGFHPSDGNVFFIGTENGLFRTQDGGISFTKVLAGGYITDIDINSNGFGYLTYQTAWNSTTPRVYKTINNGITWQLTVSNPPNGLHLLKVITHPSDVNTVYILSGKGRFACGDAELFRSTNSGASWMNLSTNLNPILDVELDPQNPSNVFLTTMEASCSAQYYWTSVNGNFYKSTDGGDTWGNPLSNNTGVIWPSTTNANIIRLIDPREPWPWNSKSGTYTSTDGGSSFTKTGDVVNWDTFFNNDLFYCYSSSYNGIIMTLGKDLSDNNNYFWVNYQWIFKTTDDGGTFHNIFTNTTNNQTWTSRGIDNVNMMDVDANKTNPDLIYQAYFDIGLWKSTDHGTSWYSCNPANYTGGWNGHGGNCAEVLSDPLRPNIVWATMSGNQQGQSPTYLLKNAQEGNRDQWNLSNNGLPQNLVMGLSIDNLSVTNNRTLYITANHDVYKSTDDGANWSKVFDCNGCNFTAVDHFNSSLIYAGGAGGVWKSENGGTSWDNISHADFASSGNQTFWDYGYDGVWCIETDPNIPNKVFVTAKGTSKGLYVSIDKGLNWQKLLTDNYMRKVKVAHFNSNVIYATSSSAFEAGGYNTSSNGVWYTENNGNSWSKQNNGMAYPFAMPIGIDYKMSPSVFIGSPGTGFQSSLIPSSALSVDDRVFTAELLDNKVVCKWNVDAIDDRTFRVFKSSNGLDFIEICEKKNISGGDLLFCTDVFPLPDISYYKLEETDLNGLKIGEWLAKVVNPQSSNSMTIWPNPITDNYIYISHKQMMGCEIALYNASGVSQPFNKEIISTDVVKLHFDVAQGLYFLKVFNKSTGAIDIFKIEKFK